MKVPQTQIPSRDSTIHNQIHSLLNTLATVNGALAVLHSQERDSTNGGRRDGGAEAAMETTLINVCDRLDKIVQSDINWDLNNHARMETAIASAYESADALQRVSLTPHHRYKPTLYRLENGDWVAILGSLENIKQSIVGIGSCPDEALRVFDEFFQGRVPDALAHRLAEREAAIQSGQEPPPFTNEKSMEPRGDNSPENPVSEEHPHTGNRPHPPKKSRRHKK